MEQAVLISPMEDILSLQSDFLSSKSMESRKALGQYFTGDLVSEYMASLVHKPETSEKVVRILDAGAGTGILTASAALRCLHLGCESVHAVLYELDEQAVPNLEQTLSIVQNTFVQQGAEFTFEVRNEDFVLSRPDKHGCLPKFDVSVINPPYFKYSAKDSPYAKAVSDLYRGDPNIYASFMAIVLAALKDRGQMVSITPRSFKNGLYFKGFRTYLLENSALSLIHIFKHRDKVFKNSDSAVLQENVISKFVKGAEQEDVTVRASDCDAGITSADEEYYSQSLIIDSLNDEKMIRVPESAAEGTILRQAEALPNTFEEAGYFISTGRVVEFRTRSYITEDTDIEGAVPLFRPHNVTPLVATWTGKQKKDAVFVLREKHEKHTMPNGTFVLMKRFSSKDEARRLVAGVHLGDALPYDLIGFGNKTNYLGIKGQNLEVEEAYGLAAVFNSSFMDRYFRCISGNTQVNATEIRVMRFPSRDQVRAIGEQAIKLELIETTNIDSIVNPVLGVMGIT